LKLAWKARQPDTSKEEEEARRRMEETAEKARRTEQAEKEAKMQKECDRDEALKNNTKMLTRMICEVKLALLLLYQCHGWGLDHWVECRNGRLELTKIMQQTAEKHLEMFRWQVEQGFLSDRRELEAVARCLGVYALLILINCD
jgi:hypothetical protein